MRTDFKWICFFAVLFVLCAFLRFYFPKGHENETLAVIRQGNTVIRTIDLSLVDEPYEFTIKAGGGYNTIRVEKGRIAVKSADCPDKVCVEQGYIQGGGAPIICLPHKLSISITGQTDIDAVSGGM